MRILNRYIVTDYLIVFLTALGLITFVMTIGTLIKAVDLISHGISPLLIAKFFFLNVPYILSFSMPISILFAALLLFGRLSTDNEISAMKACGMSLWRLVAPLVVLSVCLSALCVYINCQVAPVAEYNSRLLLQSSGVEEPLKLIEEGRFMTEFDGLMIYVGHKKGNKVKDVVAYELDEHGDISRSIRAERGVVEPNPESKVLNVKLYDVRIEMPDADDPYDVSKTTYVNAEYYPITLDFAKMMKSGRVWLKRSYMKTGMLLGMISYVDKVSSWTQEERDSQRQALGIEMDTIEQDATSTPEEINTTISLIKNQRGLLKLAPEDLMVEKSRMVIETNRRVSIAVACFAFMLMGIPLGVRSHRKETSIGMVMSLGIVFVYYIFIIVAKALAGYPELHPNLILWIPLIITQILGFILIRRAS